LAVAPGDTLLVPALATGPRTLIKLDVEGHESEAVAGLCGTIDRLAPMLITELIPERLSAHPSTLFSMLVPRGYRAFALGLRRTGLRRHELALRAVHALGDVTEQCDLLWLPPNDGLGFERCMGKDLS
jgi:hypothetical protein